MPKVLSQAASHTICQAVSHMDLLIKRAGEGGEGLRKGENESNGGGEETEEKAF